MKNIKKLKTNILKSNLSRQDKIILIEAIEKENLDNFLKIFFQVFSISKEVLETFDIDIGDLISDLINK